MSVELAAGLMMASLLLCLALAVPVAFSLIGVGITWALVLLGPNGLYMIVTATWTQIHSDTLLAIPLFVLMATILEFSGIGERIFEAAHTWFGGLRGGLAVATVVACTLLAAITGLAATGVIIMGVLALPEMYKRGYNKGLVLGCIPAASTLGPIIPPSVYMIILAVMAQQSVGRVFIGGVVPGLIISAAFCAYIIIRSALQPSYAPAIPKKERVSWGERLKLLKGIILPIILVFLVLGTIYGGIATPTEAAAIGAIGALVVSVIHRRLTWARLEKSLHASVPLTLLMMWVAVGGTLFAGVLRSSGIANVIQAVIGTLPIDATTMVVIMMVIGLILGMFIDGLAIIMITVPVFVPVMATMGIDGVYFVVTYTICIVIGTITPPFGMGLFYLKGIAPTESIEDIYRASIPFAIIITAVLFLCVFYPGLVTWLPSQMIR